MKKRKRSIHLSGFAKANHKTRQEPAGQTNINTIVEKVRRGIAPTWINHRAPIYADMTQVPKDLMSAYQKIQKAEEAFMALPAKIRTSIDNDPRNLESWLKNPENRPMAELHGLIVKQPDPTPSPADPGPKPAKKAEETKQ